MWKSALVEFYLPYEKNMSNLIKILSSWKKRYEKQIVQDVTDFFKSQNFDYVEKEVELNSRDKKGDHQENLGDYDVIAVDKKSRIIYLIECKFLQTVGSPYEFSMQQRNFFFQHKYDEKFQKRIDYMKNNYMNYFKSQNIELDQPYSIKALMITNKMFDSLFKKIDFEILSFEEFKNTISKTNQIHQ
jgi:hypothetical protein